MIGLLAAAMLQAAAADAAPGASWSAQSANPCDDNFMRYYPAKAQRANIAGRVVLECKALASGVLTACSVVSEDPPGYDFGDAALKMTCLFKMKPSDPATTPPAGRTVRVPLQFKLPDR